MAVNYAVTGRADDQYPTVANTMSSTYGSLGGQISPSFGNTATPQFGGSNSGQRFSDLQSALANIGYQRTGVQRERAMTLDDLGRQFQQTRRPIPGQFNRRGMLDSGQYQRSVGRTYEDELRRAGRYEAGVQEALNARAAQQFGAEQQYASGRAQDALAAAQAKAQQLATIREGTFPALTSTLAAPAEMPLGIPTLPDIPPVVAPPAPVAAPEPVVVTPPPPPPPPPAPAPAPVPDLAHMAAVADSFRARAAEEEVRRAAAISAAEAGDPSALTAYTSLRGVDRWGKAIPQRTTTIAPTVLNPSGAPSGHTINVPWGETGGPGDPAFKVMLADAAQRMVENLVFDPAPAMGGPGTYKGINLITGAAIPQERERVLAGGYDPLGDADRRQAQAKLIRDTYSGMGMGF